VACADCAEQAVGGGGNSGQELRRVKAAQRRVEEAAGLGGVGQAAVDQQVGHDRGDAQVFGQVGKLFAGVGE
jgi:hypothetical protein